MLKEEVKRLDQEHVEKQEMEYIAQSVHEVMEKLGYDILATDYMVRKKAEWFIITFMSLVLKKLSMCLSQTMGVFFLKLRVSGKDNPKWHL